jgi:hypothetical protein
MVKALPNGRSSVLNAMIEEGLTAVVFGEA